MALAVETSEIHRLSSEEYQQMVDSGALQDVRVELIDGLLCDMSPRSPAHEQINAYLTRTLATALDHSRYQLRVASALSIGNSAPEPDFAVVDRRTPEPYHPGSAALVIEVAVSSRQRDLDVKPAIYASADVTEYWVIDVEGSRALVHREAAGDGYRIRLELGVRDALDGSIVGIGEIPVAAVLGAATSGH